MIKLFNIDDASWQEDMEVNDEKKYKMNFSTGLKVRWKAVSDHDLPQREFGVQHNVKANMSR